MSLMQDEMPHNPKMFAALNLLENVCQPLLRGRQPYWTPEVVIPQEDVFIPSWHAWVSPHTDLPADDEAVTLDVNGAYLAAAGSVDIAHSQLFHHGPLDAYDIRPREVPCGYYLIETSHWAFSGTIVSPLGNGPRAECSTRVWVAHPTLQLLLELLDDGSLGSVNILDSWFTDRKVNLRKWVARLKTVRGQLLDHIDTTHPGGRPDECECAGCTRYVMFKEGYSAAFSLMLTGRSCRTRRPDWSHAVYAQHAASMWRKAWRFTTIGPVISMGVTDELTVLRADLERAANKAMPPFRLDETGRMLGALKEKHTTTTTSVTRPSLSLVLSDPFEDIL